MTPQFIPLPPGEDKATQIEDGELFDFELEVIPILQVLVGRSLLYSRYELIQEFEKEEHKKHRIEYEQRREFELMNLQRVEAARIRREKEKERRQQQIILKKQLNIQMQKKLTSRVFSKSYLNNLRATSLKSLRDLGYFK